MEIVYRHRILDGLVPEIIRDAVREASAKASADDERREGVAVAVAADLALGAGNSVGAALSRPRDVGTRGQRARSAPSTAVCYLDSPAWRRHSCTSDSEAQKPDARMASRRGRTAGTCPRSLHSSSTERVPETRSETWRAIRRAFLSSRMSVEGFSSRERERERLPPIRPLPIVSGVPLQTVGSGPGRFAPSSGWGQRRAPSLPQVGSSSCRRAFRGAQAPPLPRAK